MCTWYGGVPGRGVYLVRGGLPGLMGCTWSGGCTRNPGGCVYLVRGGVPGRGCTWSQGVYYPILSNVMYIEAC